MIGALVSLLSLNVTALLIQSYSVVAQTYAVTGATATTPINLTVASHGIPPGRITHGIVSGVSGTTEANGLWALTVVDSNTLSLSTFTPQGTPEQSVGVNAYVSGGQIQTAFPDGSILLGRRNLALATQATSPRIVFVPTDGRAWNFESYAGAAPNIQPATLPNVRGSLEQQAMKLSPQLATEYLTFEVYVSGSGPNTGNALSPDFYDFDATQTIVFALWEVIFNATGQRAKVLHESWPSQAKDAATQLQRGQQWMGVIEFQEPVALLPAQFVPIGTSLVETVIPLNPGSGDATIITITQKNGP